MDEFEEVYGGQGENFDYYIHDYDGRTGFYSPSFEEHFKRPLDRQVALLSSLPSELEARRHSYIKELSSELSLSELDQARVLLDADFKRAAGVVARVALEGFVRTLYSINIQATPIPKFDKCIIELKNNGIIEERHRKHLAELYGLGSECAHPGSTITKAEIERMISEAKQMIATLP